MRYPIVKTRANPLGDKRHYLRERSTGTITTRCGKVLDASKWRVYLHSWTPPDCKSCMPKDACIVCGT